MVRRWAKKGCVYKTNLISTIVDIVLNQYDLTTSIRLI